MYFPTAVASNFVLFDLDKDNTLEQPSAITPQETPVSIEGNVFVTELEPTTFAVYKFKKK